MRLLLLLLLPLVAEASILKAIHSVLSYYDDPGQTHVTDSFIFGVMLLNGQLNALKLINKDINNDLDRLLEACETFIEKNSHFIVTKDMVKRVEESLKLLMTEEIKHLKTPKHLRYELEKNLIHGSPTNPNSTFCLLEAMMLNEVPDICIEHMADADARGYSLSHQGLFYVVAASLLPLPFVQESLEERCEKMLSEVTYAWENGMPVTMRDIVIEEVAICGINKYQEFLKEPMLDFILSLQREEGCFSLTKPGPLNKCEPHLSAVSICALANFLYVYTN